jgi:hypothetical protein
MRALLITSLLLAGLVGTGCSTEPVANAPETLFSLSVQVERAEDGKSLRMTIRETIRMPEFSIVDANVVSGDSKTSPLYLVRGFCGVMRARGQRLAVAEQIAARPVQYRLSFPNEASTEDTKGPPRMVLSEADCTRIQERKIQQ